MEIRRRPDYRFTDEIFAEKFRAEQMLGNLAFVFTLLSVLISCLGLFGLVTFSAEQRQKEIGTRKVLGASISSLLLRLSGEFIGLVGLHIFLFECPKWDQ